RLVGQDRPLEALEFGVAIEGSAFNIFVVGEQGTGRRAAALAELRRRAATRPVPDEWCYVNNFDDPRHPRALRVPPGTARRPATTWSGSPPSSPRTCRRCSAATSTGSGARR